jgi:hypothetical protein
VTQAATAALLRDRSGVARRVCLRLQALGLALVVVLSPSVRFGSAVEQPAEDLQHEFMLAT